MAWRCLQPIATHSIADALEVQLEEPGADMVRMAYRPDGVLYCIVLFRCMQKHSAITSRVIVESFQPHLYFNIYQLFYIVD